MRVSLLATLAALALLPAARADDKPAPKPLDPALAKMARMIGGIWSNDNPKFRVEFRYDWAFNQTAVRGVGVIDKGGPNETPVEATFGWDADKKTVYYLDNHGGNQVYKGTVRLDGDSVVLEFATLIGPPAKWRSVGKFADKDTYQFTIYGDKDGKWTPVVEQTLKRKQPPTDASRQVTEGIIDAPLDKVWNAFTTKGGQEAWNVAHSEIDLKIGGTMRTHYNAKGKIGDPNTIENIILAFEPKKMLTIQVGKPPEKFPFKEAIKNVWHVMYFEEAGPNRTRLRVVGLGYGADDESKKLRAFFEKGNAYTLKKLQEHLGKKSGKQDWPLKDVKTKPAEITVLSGTTFRCGAVPCQLLGVKEADDPAVRRRAKEFTKAWFKSLGNYIGVYNDSNPLMTEDGVAIVWIRGYDSSLSCLNEQLVRAGLATVDATSWKEYTFTVPTKASEKQEDWQGILRKAKEGH